MRVILELLQPACEAMAPPLATDTVATQLGEFLPLLAPIQWPSLPPSVGYILAHACKCCIEKQHVHVPPCRW
jgi:hypothetical protein